MDKNNINNYSITKIREAMKANNINNNQLKIPKINFWGF